MRLDVQSVRGCDGVWCGMLWCGVVWCVFVHADVRSVGGCDGVWFGVVWCACVEIARRVDVVSGSHQQVARAGILGGWHSSLGLVLIADARTHRAPKGHGRWHGIF